MSSEAVQPGGGLELQFGPFRLFPQQRLLLRTNTPMRLGSRTREILFALVERAGEIVMKSELIARVWPNTVVEEGTLRVHVNALRNALGCGKSGVRYVENVTGRGYLFIAPVTRREEPRARQPGLTIPLTRMIGREPILAALTARLAQAHSSHRRFLTVVGAGGSGKSTVAANLADSLRASYPDGARLIDLAAASSTTCSQLSNTSNICFFRSRLIKGVTSSRVLAPHPSDAATAARGDALGAAARSMRRAPSG